MYSSTPALVELENAAWVSLTSFTASEMLIPVAMEIKREAISIRIRIEVKIMNDV